MSKKAMIRSFKVSRMKLNCNFSRKNLKLQSLISVFSLSSNNPLKRTASSRTKLSRWKIRSRCS